MRSKFKSFTDINNYNNFLLDLDKKQKTMNQEPKPTKDKTLPELVNDINKTYNTLQYSNNNFTGVNNWDRIFNLLKKMDPNLYEEKETDKKDDKKDDKKVGGTKSKKNKKRCTNKTSKNYKKK